jgi:hypothetical protein
VKDIPLLIKLNKKIGKNVQTGLILGMIFLGQNFFGQTMEPGPKKSSLEK